MAFCEQCGKEYDGSFGSGRFCSRSCSNKWVALHQSEEAKARKVEAGKKNLDLGRGSISSWNEVATKEDINSRNARSAKSRTENAESRRRDVLKESLVSGIYPED